MAISGRLYGVAEAQRAALLRGERDAAAQLIQAFGGIWQRLRREIDALLRARTEAEGRGESVGAEWLYQMDRLEQLLQQVEGELRVFAQYAEPIVANAQGNAVDAALRHAEELTRAAAGRAGVGIEWNRLPTGPLRELVGFTADGSPLRALFDRMGPAGSQAIRDGLMQGVALGWNPERIARELRDRFARGLTQALTTCRTEIMRSYREASLMSYRANDDVLEGWIWNAACTPRTCAMCWAMHGTTHPLTERLDDHPNGRCVMLPLLRNARQWRPEAGVDQFAKLEPNVQRNILGPLYELYESGQISLADVVGRRFDPNWGSMRFARSRADILKGKA